MGEPVLKAMARELTETIRKNVSIDWTQRETARAKLRTLVKRLLRKYKYPPDRQESATQTVMEQAERLCETWAEDGELQNVVVFPRADEDPARPLPLAAEPPPRLTAQASRLPAAAKKPED